MKKFHINTVDQQNLRVDKWLKRNFSTLKQSFIEKNIRKGNIKINKKKISSNYRLKLDDIIEIYNYSTDSYKNIDKFLNKKEIPSKYKKIFISSILFENSDFIILDKWSGIATQGGSKINISIDDIIKNISPKYNLVHRLDRETSGLLIIAKNLQTTKIFGKLFREQLISKIYFAICQGVPKNKESEVELLIENKKNFSKSSNSLTRYKVCQNNKNCSTLLFAPSTGKTHQIRIVAKHLGTPIIGDTKYNKMIKDKTETLKLNACSLKFKVNNKNYQFSSNLPDHFKKFMKKNNLKIIEKKNINF